MYYAKLIGLDLGNKLQLSIYRDKTQQLQSLQITVSSFVVALCYFPLFQNDHTF